MLGQGANADLLLDCAEREDKSMDVCRAPLWLTWFCICVRFATGGSAIGWTGSIIHDRGTFELMESIVARHNAVTATIDNIKC